MNRHELCQDRLNLVFLRAEDRWSHQLVLRGHNDAPDVCRSDVVLLTAIEGNSDQAWPPSPPLQEIDRHDLGRGRAALLGVGKSGQSHWSAAFELETFQLSPAFRLSSESVDAGPKCETHALRMELACLSSAAGQTGSLDPEGGQLSSQYRLSEQLEVIGWEPEFTLQLACQDFLLTVSPLTGAGWGTAVRVEGPTLILSPTQVSHHPRQPTRWGYRVARASF